MSIQRTPLTTTADIETVSAFGEYEYVSPTWIDRYDRQTESYYTYSGTTISVLNAGKRQGKMTVFFYDYKGAKYNDMNMEMYIPAGHVEEFRVRDVIIFKNPNLVSEDHLLRAGWLKIYSTAPFVISGTIHAGGKSTQSQTVEHVWPIYFEKL